MRVQSVALIAISRCYCGTILTVIPNTCSRLRNLLKNRVRHLLEVFAAFPRMESEARLGLQQIKPKAHLLGRIGALGPLGLPEVIVAAIAIEILH